MKAPNRIISPHEMSIILSEIAEFTRTTGSTTWEEITAELIDAGYTDVEISQVHVEWKRGQVERTPFTVDLTEFGEGTVSVVPNFDPGTTGQSGINLEINHQFLPHEAAVLISIGEADQLLFGLDKCIVQTGGMSHLAPDPTESLRHALVGPGAADTHQIYETVREAVSVDAGAVREALAAMVLAVSDQLKETTVAEIAFNAAQDALALEGDLEA